MYSLIDGEKEGGEQLSLGLLRRISRSTRGQSSKLGLQLVQPFESHPKNSSRSSNCTRKVRHGSCIGFEFGVYIQLDAWSMSGCS
jgi:hypothetical protein